MNVCPHGLLSNESGRDASCLLIHVHLAGFRDGDVVVNMMPWSIMDNVHAYVVRAPS